MRLANLQNRIINNAVAASPQLSRGQVWCLSCGVTQRVDPHDCLARGWPKCCGATMSIDPPANA